MQVATRSFTATTRAGVATVEKGERFADSHELVRLFPDKFKRIADGRPDVEDATAAPGKKRGE